MNYFGFRILYNYCLKYCKEPFSVTSFLQHKLKFAQPRFNINCYASGKKQYFTDIPNAELFDTLKRWRDEVCEEANMPIYMVANQATLREITTYLPLTKKEIRPFFKITFYRMRIYTSYEFQIFFFF